MKASPFDISNNGESLDQDFFKRLIRMEESFRKKSDDPIYRSSCEAMHKINSLLQAKSLSLDDIRSSISIYNDAIEIFQQNKTGWYDLSLHLRHIAYVYGETYDTDKDLRLIKKES